jgi:hypothetical protein
LSLKAVQKSLIATHAAQSIDHTGGAGVAAHQGITILILFATVLDIIFS